MVPIRLADNHFVDDDCTDGHIVDKYILLTSIVCKLINECLFRTSH